MSQELQARFNRAKQNVTNANREVDRIEAQVEVAKEGVIAKTQVLTEKGITFNTDEELEQIRQDKEMRATEIVERMEQALDMSQPVGTQTNHVNVNTPKPAVRTPQPPLAPPVAVDTETNPGTEIVDFGDFSETGTTEKQGVVVDFSDLEIE
ncbi:hypothetical protein CN495_07425 [Bacillus thuringiensis]|uniref:Uncharacterized protein n=1 Tax=Bacillus thuringiensis TaxID=1428 RepID=A0ABD6SEH3_BACTU|nr:hypothetical protein [Bacillus thuringiensis]PER55576.1 hypothetical protein CN495_07425 [Bacillus thuringiensis]